MEKKINKPVCVYGNVDVKKFVSNCGNGKAVPQYELKDGKVIPKLDSNGKQVTRNLYKEIQLAKGITDIAELIKKYPDEVIVEPNWGNSDVSNIDGNDLDDMLNAQNRVNAIGGMAAIDKIAADIAAKYKAQYIEMIKKQQAAKAENGENAKKVENK